MLFHTNIQLSTLKSDLIISDEKRAKQLQVTHVQLLIIFKNKQKRGINQICNQTEYPITFCISGLKKEQNKTKTKNKKGFQVCSTFNMKYKGSAFFQVNSVR